jgi:HAD superfamily hydrolase (TIGR01509 family)
MNQSLSLPRGVLLDMDGTLTCPMLDFPRIKRDMGIGARPILEALAEMSPADRARAEAILHGHEDEAAANSALNPGCRELLSWLNERQIGIALITRNRRTSVETVLRRHGLHIDVRITRDDGLFKPDPAPLLEACRRLGVDPPDAWMVGDGQYDVEAGHAAGVPTVWLSHNAPRPFAARPWRTVSDLHELLALLRSAQPREDQRV